ncbi:sulfite exporter TauE/SafE family protein [Moraxella sp. Tifton1]|uniref:Probable membrane transporter protein n=1 Tax=Moraxella oculi TaxID=2940516 RepID=A0ABW8U580_9GAMM|nr:sulfite exporter TauE/SafE family protein [Moraxella sp. Tifton1]MCL1623032.1 sulfite exporter TauE/SafE family protein [Moraxella sp. Tifton1]
MMYLWFVIAGAFAGVCAGLFGVGGGLIIVPALVWILAAYGFPSEIIPHVSVGTALATIIITSISSLTAHNKKGGVRWEVFKNLTYGLVVGSLFGAWVATLIHGQYLQGLIGAFAIVMSIQMFMKKAEENIKPLPKPINQSLAGGVIGMASAIFGIGGGSLNVPYLTHAGLPIKQAVGTSAACGLPIAIAGALGFMIFGREYVAGLDGSVSGLIGFVHLPAFAAISMASFITAKLGAKIAHKLPANTLKKAFACLLMVVGCQLVWSGVMR